ncbi:MAG: DUF2087 domain-containing protein [Ardenticatenaceae bacterium]
MDETYQHEQSTPGNESPLLFELCKVLLDEERLRLIGALTAHPATAARLREELSFKEAALMRHLQLLAGTGLVARRSEGMEAEYYLNKAALEDLKRKLFAGPPAHQELTPEEEMLGRFVQEGRLQHMPTHPEKLKVVLAWLAEQFETDVEYPEREVNRILQQRHPDHATFRRLLVDYGFMERRAGIYWKATGQDQETVAGLAQEPIEPQQESNG